MPPTLLMVSLLGKIAAEIVGMALAKYGSPDNSYYVSSVFAEAVEAHLERVLRIELNPTLSLFLIFYFWGTLVFSVSPGSRLGEKIIGRPENGPTTPLRAEPQPKYILYFSG